MKERILALKENSEEKKQMLLTAVPLIVLILLIIFFEIVSRGRLISRMNIGALLNSGFFSWGNRRAVSYIGRICGLDKSGPFRCCCNWNGSRMRIAEWSGSCKTQSGGNHNHPIYGVYISGNSGDLNCLWCGKPAARHDVFGKYSVKGYINGKCICHGGCVL